MKMKATMKKKTRKKDNSHSPLLFKYAYMNPAPAAISTCGKDQSIYICQSASNSIPS